MQRVGGLTVRYESFGGIIATEDPPGLAFADRDFVRNITGNESPLWSGRELRTLTAPVEAHYAITRSCTIGCPGCYMASVSGETPPVGENLEHAKKIIDTLSGMGVFHVALGGGESFLVPWFIELARYARASRMVPNVTTSGLAFTDTLLEECRIFGQVNVSMDGIGDIYSRTRPGGSFEEADGALRKLGEKGVRRGINCVITRENFNSLEDIVSYARRMGLADIEFLRYKPAGRGKELYRDMRLTPSQARDLLPVMKRLSRKYRVSLKLDCSFTPFICHHRPAKKVLEFFAIMGCDAGNWLIGVSPAGMVSPCSFVEGDVCAVSELPGIWKDDTTFSVYRDWDRETKTACARCDYVSICKGGCHAVAKFVTGSSLEPDPECPFIAGIGV